MSYELRILRKTIKTDEILICPLPTEDVLQYRTSSAAHPIGPMGIGTAPVTWSEWKDVPIVEEVSISQQTPEEYERETFAKHIADRLMSSGQMNAKVNANGLMHYLIGCLQSYKETDDKT